MISEQTKRLLREKKQEHLLAYFEQLSPEGQAALAGQLEQLDWKELDLSAHTETLGGRGVFTPIPALETAELAAQREQYEKCGLEAIERGEVAAVLLAGGQGSRLGFEGPKGTYQMGLTKDLSIFSLLIGNLKSVAQRAGTWIHLYIMTSEINHAGTEKFFKEKGYFDYPQDYIHFFVQDMAPAVDFEGKLYMSAMDRLAYSPNGNGGWFVTMAKRGLLTHVHENGIKWLNVFAVDNVLQQIADPVFVGATLSRGVTCGAKVIRKTDPQEKVGVLCCEDGVPSIVEYYDMPEDMAKQTNEDGRLTYCYGVTLNYLFQVDNLERILDRALPVHLAKKKIDYMKPDGEAVKASVENGYKFEYLVLDMIRYMDSCLACEVVREKEFAPVKNLTGVDSVDTAREYLRKNGIEL